MVRRGTFIVIEGTDGSGKGTQFKLLQERLQTAGYQVQTFDFPQYGHPSSYFVQQYLNGQYGSADEVGPYTASLFYALDRYQSAIDIRKALDAGKIVLCNRFTGSSMAHQGGKFHRVEERRGYFIWLDNLEFEMLHIPRPDISFVLRVPANIAEELIDKKEPRSYTDKKRDIHEADHSHLERSVAVYDDICRLFPKDFQRIDCVRGDTLLDIETIQHMLWEKISPQLPTPPQLEMPMPAVKAATTPALSVTERVKQIRKAAADDRHPTAEITSGDPPKEDPPTKEKPKPDYTTNPESPIYAFTNALPPQVIAAVMATLSRSSGILSATVLKAFGEAARKDATFVPRVLEDYGDQSVHQLVSQQVIVTGASALLAKKLEWGRMAAYTEPYVEFVRPELKSSSGRYKYFTPRSLTAAIATQYNERMDQIYSRYSTLLPKLISYLEEHSETPPQAHSAEWKASLEATARKTLQAIVPVANTATVGVYASAQAFENLIIRLSGDELPEAQRTGQHILRELRKTIPAFMENADRPDRGGADVVYRANTRRAVELFAEDQIPETYAPQTEAVQLTDVWPRNELDLVPDMLYAKTNLPLSTIRRAVQNWPYSRKIDAFEAYMGRRLNRRQLPGRAIEKARYSWDLVTSFNVFRDLQRHRIVDDLEWQLLTPRGGYEVPQILEDAGLSDDFEDCFDISLALHSMLQEAGYELEAQYATLAGHRLRWKLTYNARQAFRFHELHTSPKAAPETRALVTRMHEHLAEVHPMLAEAMQFVGQPEDPELNGLGAEQAKQFSGKRI